MRLSAPIFRLKRRAKLLAREREIPLSAALNQIAGSEGFQSWSHLSASASHQRPASKILSHLSPGDLVLLGARPGQGKTLLGLELIIEAIKWGRPGFFFTLEYHEVDVLGRLRSLGVDPKTIKESFTLDTSDDICAEHVITKLREAPSGAIAVIDYLQLLDQKRRNPELPDQISALKAFAGKSGSIIVAISQIDRSFDLRAKPLPELSDVRLPNPLALTLFTKTCFMHEGEVRLEAVP
jgi:replicative DNA helicase